MWIYYYRRLQAFFLPIERVSQLKGNKGKYEETKNLDCPYCKFLSIAWRKLESRNLKDVNSIS